MFRALCTLASVAGLLSLAACGGTPDPIWQQAFGFNCANQPGSGADVLCKSRPAENDPETVSRYCYQSLGDANCFDQPDVMSKNQELGSSGK